MVIMFRDKSVMIKNSRSLNIFTLMILLITIFGNMSVMNIAGSTTNSMNENFRMKNFRKSDHSDYKSLGRTISGKEL